MIHFNRIAQNTTEKSLSFIIEVLKAQSYELSDSSYVASYMHIVRAAQSKNNTISITF